MKRLAAGEGTSELAVPEPGGLILALGSLTAHAAPSEKTFLQQTEQGALDKCLLTP